MSGKEDSSGALTGRMVLDKHNGECHIVTYTFRYAPADGVVMTFDVDPTRADPIAWSGLVDAIKTNQKYELSMSNEGYVTIGHAEGQVSFDIDNCTCDGNLKLTMPASKCVAALEQCAAAYAAHDPVDAVTLQHQ
ncbi:hypothetical protein pmac_cds_278 [Pandoravirus macleodensis]|uniref:Uncharacterized protein n=1 Tax=Pandoravirus macleodensis TaxID=2107707 RepID=A0A2U7UEU7_9VIRU|nr:hypothetical protein pmac_cds_278 [Pandoravirus macleodensis]AVK76966.1 hypothetical protein pmac_cds_278 [Pandoravirus macleodensis]